MAQRQAPQRIVQFMLVVVIIQGILLGGGPARAGEEGPPWTYGGVANPTHWGELEADFAACEVGQSQSPLNLTAAGTPMPAQLLFNYAPTPLEVVNTGRTIQVNYAPGSTVSIDGDEYELLQFHFHTPSEHWLDGEAAAMELHLVHRNAAGALAAIGVMIVAGETNPVIAGIWEAMSAPDAAWPGAVTLVNAADLLPSQTPSYFSYAGSLTTPPCSEGVRWTVLADPIELSAEQIATFERLYPVNARPIQPSHDRRVEFHLARTR